MNSLVKMIFVFACFSLAFVIPSNNTTLANDSIVPVAQVKAGLCDISSEEMELSPDFNDGGATTTVLIWIAIVGLLVGGATCYEAKKGSIPVVVPPPSILSLDGYNENKIRITQTSNVSFAGTQGQTLTFNHKKTDVVENGKVVAKATKPNPEELYDGNGIDSYGYVRVKASTKTDGPFIYTDAKVEDTISKPGTYDLGGSLSNIRAIGKTIDEYNPRITY